MSGDDRELKPERASLSRERASLSREILVFLLVVGVIVGAALLVGVRVRGR